MNTSWSIRLKIAVGLDGVVSVITQGYQSIRLLLYLNEPESVNWREKKVVPRNIFVLLQL